VHDAVPLHPDSETLRAHAEDHPLVSGFRTSPAVAKPRTWWHWVNGNVTEQGVRLDLEWMRRIGLGGVTNIDAAIQWGSVFDTPSQVEIPIAYRTAEWGRLLRFSVALAHEKGLEFGIASSAGWSESGGPWVLPQQAMKKLVWSETWIEGGVAFKGHLVPPPKTTGLFQNIPLLEWGLSAEELRLTPTCYADVATIAYRASDGERLFAELEPEITSSAGPITGTFLSDGDLAMPVRLPFSDRPTWIQFSFARPQRIQAITAVIARPASWNPLRETGPRAWLEMSEDGQCFHKVIDLPQTGALQQTAAFAPVRARWFRVMIEGSMKPGRGEKLGVSPPAVAHEICELVLHTAPRVNRFEDKAGYSSRAILEADDTPKLAAEDVLRKREIIDLTARMAPDGSLDWTPPAGRWVVLRFGYSLTGRTNFSASRPGRGLEVDKLNRQHVKSYMDAYLLEYERVLGQLLIGRQGLQYVLTDSYEAGPQNWTEDMLEQFRRRRGYEATPWLAVVAGRVVETPTASDRFLWDFRQTLAELMAEAHYGQISDSLQERGLRRYGESHERFRAFIGDGMKVKESADIPMGACWAAGPPEFTLESSDADIRESASVAHLYGKPLVAGEAFTAFGNPYGFAPETLKPIADRAMAMGLNRFVIHTSVHQPHERPGPGLSLGPFGQWFTRKETWAEQASPWIAYLTRSSYLLQQGRFVADIAYLYGEDTNVTALFDASAPPVPAGYPFDFVNPDALRAEFTVTGGLLVTHAGMQYRVLALDASTRRLSVPVLRKLRELVEGGAIVSGNRPVATPSLADDEEEFRMLVSRLWGAGAGERRVGLGRVFANVSLAETLASFELTPDVTFSSSRHLELRSLHRVLPEGDLYFVSSDSAQPVSTEVSFRLSGKRPEVWRADTGAIQPVSFRVENGRTIVPLRLDVHDAVFVVFRHPTLEQRVVVPETIVETLSVLNGPWDVEFPPGLGAPERIHLDRLCCWTQRPETGVQYFSGTATYRNTMQVAPEWLHRGSRMFLNLGAVKHVAEVAVNGAAVGVSWKEPFTIDISDQVVAGENHLEIRVTNLWRNRLIGDKRAGMQQVVYASFDPFKGDEPPLASGLLGPVTLSAVSASAVL
jgi:hypothetical protein